MDTEREKASQVSEAKSLIECVIGRELASWELLPTATRLLQLSLMAFSSNQSIIQNFCSFGVFEAVINVWLILFPSCKQFWFLAEAMVYKILVKT